MNGINNATYKRHDGDGGRAAKACVREGQGERERIKTEKKESEIEIYTKPTTAQPI
jgi:hypothetical protein